MPSKSEKQRRFMGAELSRRRSGERTETDMSEKQLGDYASKDEEEEEVEFNGDYAINLIEKYLNKDKKNVCPKCGKEDCKGNGIEKETLGGGTTGAGGGMGGTVGTLAPASGG